MRILVDMDSIIVDLHTEWYRRLNEMSDASPVGASDVTSWCTHRFFPHLKRDDVYAVLEEPGFIGSLQPILGAMPTLEKWSLEDDHHIVICSSPAGPRGAMEKLQWLKRWLGHIPHDVVLTKEKYLVRGDVLIDDGPHNARKWGAVNPTRYVITIAYPYNEDPAYHLRAEGWYDTEKAWREIDSFVSSLM